MMRRMRWSVFGAIGLAGLTLVCAYLSRPYPEPGVRWENIGRIEVGMTVAEVEAVIGCPPQSVWAGDPIERGPPGTHASLMWSDVECDIWVFVDREGWVIGREGVGRRPPWYERLRQWLGL